MRNITAKLAFRQIQRNRKRTAGTVTAIALSAALLTAVLSFASSVLTMLQTALGDSFAEYAGAYRLMVFFPAFVLTFLIAFMAVTVISNIFQASASERVKELGILRCIGGTTDQIRRTVISEGLIVSVIGIPAGLLAGTALGYAGVAVAGHYIDRLAEITRSIVMQSFDLQLSFIVGSFVYPAAAMFTLIIVLLSASKPATQMSGIPAVECVKFGTAAKETVKEVSGNKLWKKLWGLEGELGARNVNRNRRSFEPAIRAFSAGICLLLVTAGLSAQFGDLRKLMQSGHNRLVVDYVSLRDEGVDAETGRRADVVLHPIDAETYNAINEQLNAYGDFTVWGIGSNRESYFAKADEAQFSEEMKAQSDALNEYGEMSFDMVSVTEDLYRELCEASGTAYGGNILINTYVYNDQGIRKEIPVFTESLTELSLVTPQGESSTISVDGFLDRGDTEEWLFDAPNRTTVMLITPGAEARYFDWYAEPGAEEEGYVAYAQSLLDSYFPNTGTDSYDEVGYSVRISREDTMVMALNVMLVLAEVIMYSFVALLTLMGAAGFLSTIIAGIRGRSREFAVLKSVGMTNGKLQKMLYSESALCTAKAAIKGTAFGILIPWLINLAIRQAVPVRYHLPGVAAVCGLGIAFAVVLLITRIEITKMKGQSLIETIRMDA